MEDYWNEAKEFMQKFQGEFATKNKDELLVLQNLHKEHLFDEGIFQKYMQNKCVVSISPYSHKLLLHFIQLRMLVIILHIFNMHIEFRVTSDRWILDQHSSTALLLPYTAEQLEEINKKGIAWGRLLVTPEAHALKVLIDLFFDNLIAITTKNLQEAVKSRKGDVSLMLPAHIRIPLANLDLLGVF